MSPPSIPVEVRNDEKEAQHNELRWLSRVEKGKECRGKLGIGRRAGTDLNKQNDNAECGRLRKWALENWRTRKIGDRDQQRQAKGNVGGLCFTSISNAKCWSLAKANQQAGRIREWAVAPVKRRRIRKVPIQGEAQTRDGFDNLRDRGCGKTLGCQIWVQSATRWVRQP